MDKVISPKNSFKGWNFFTLLNRNKKGVTMALTMLLFLFLVVKMLASSTMYSVEQVILQPAGISAAFWTAMHAIFYRQNEQKK